MRRVVALVLLVSPTLRVAAEEVRPRWAIDPGEHRLRVEVTQRMGLTPPGHEALKVEVYTAEVWKAKVRAVADGLSIALSCESIRWKTPEMTEEVEVDPSKEPARGDLQGTRLAALKGLTFALVMRPDGEVLKIETEALPLKCPEWLAKEVHDAAWDPMRVTEPLREMWVLLPESVPKGNEAVTRDDTTLGTRRVRGWAWTTEEKDHPRRLAYASSFPAGAPSGERDDMTILAPDVVAVAWNAPREEGHADIDPATGIVTGAESHFRTGTRVTVRRGETLETWQGDLSVDRTLRVDPK